MDNQFLVHQFFSVLGEDADSLLDRISIEKRKVIKNMLLNPIMPSNSLELENVLSFVLVEKNTQVKEIIQAETSVEDVNEPEKEKDESVELTEESPVNSNEHRIEENPRKNISKIKSIATFLQKQNHQLVALYLSKLTQEYAEELKAEMEKTFLIQVSKINIDTLPNQDVLFEVINTEIEKLDL